MNLKNDLVPLLRETWEEFQQDDASQLGAALAYYAMFSIFPLLLLLLAVLGFVLRYWDEAIDAQEQILQTVAQNFSPQLSVTLREVLAGIQQRAGAATGIGIFTLLLGASGVFQQLNASFDKIWKVPAQPQSESILASIKTVLQSKLFSFGMMLALGFLLLVSLALTGLTQALLHSVTDIPVVGGITGFMIGLILTMVLNTVTFALIYKYLPNTNVRWSDVWLGAFLTALVWEIAKRLLALYISRSGYDGAYGAVGAMLVLMAWIYFSSQILFLGAEFTEVFSRRHGSRTPVQPPAPTIAPPMPLAPPTPLPPPATPATRVALATGAGLLVGTLGGLLAGAVAFVIGARRAAIGLTRWVRRSVPRR